MKIRASEISDRLADCAESVAADLLPGGKRQGGLYRAGSVAGESGQSLALHLHGPKRGQWTDHATSEYGDLLDLWAQSKGLSVTDAMKEAAAYLGLDVKMDRAPVRPKVKSYQTPSKEKVTKLTDAHRQWLEGDRKLSAETIEKFKLASEGDAVVFPFIGPDGKAFAAKYRTPDKKFRSAPGCRPGLFGWQAIDARARVVALTEGEPDAMALSQYGVPALSVPNGGGGDGKQEHWIAEEYDNLARFDKIYLVLDSDDPGKLAMAEIIDRLGRERCFVVALPQKDANDCLMAGVTEDEIRQCFRESKSLDPDQLRKPIDFLDSVESLFFDNQLDQAGFAPPFAELQDKLRHRPQELIIIAGPNGSGKSQYSGHLMCEAMKEGHSVCIASMEFRPERYLQRMIRQVTTLREPTRGYLRHAMEWLNESAWVFSQTGTANINEMLEVFEYARRRYGIKVFLIDNLAKCGFDEDDYNGQKKFVDRLSDFARDTDSTVFLVHHMRKDGEGKNGIKGTGAITDMADTVLTVWRNHGKERDIEEARMQGAEPDPDIEGLPDGVITCVKQRNGEHEPKKGIWFDRDSFQFLGGPSCKAFRYCTDYKAPVAAGNHNPMYGD